jgi:hypothetical protein
MFGIAAGYLARSGLTVTDISRSIQRMVPGDADSNGYFISLTPLDFQGRVLATPLRELDDFSIALRGADKPSDILIARCRELLTSPPAADWQPIVAPQSK